MRKSNDTDIMPTFSIIIPCYNDGDYAIDAIDSCIQQLYPAHEIILIDDGSTDATFSQISKRYAHSDQIKAFSKLNGGLSSARNYGIDKATGDFMVFLDSDDKIAPRFLATAANAIMASEKRENLLVISSFEYFSDSDEFRTRTAKKKKLRPPLLTGTHILDYLIVLASNRFPVSSCIIMRDLIRAAGYFDEELRSLEDWDYWIRVMQKKPQVKYMPFSTDTCTQIRVRDGMMTNTVKMRQSRSKIHTKHWHGMYGWLLRNWIFSPLIRRLIRWFAALQYLRTRHRINLTK